MFGRRRYPRAFPIFKVCHMAIMTILTSTRKVIRAQVSVFIDLKGEITVLISPFTVTPSGLHGIAVALNDAM